MSTCQIVNDVVKNLILDNHLVKINGTDYSNDKDNLQNVSLKFSCSSGGLCNGCIGTIDGWIVMFRKSRIKDNVSDMRSFFSRKGFSGLNVIAIMDKKKRLIYHVIASRGTEYDLTAFKSSKFYKLLTKNW